MPVSQDTVQRVGAPRQDDLTCIAGIGPEIVRRLDEAGIRTYADLGACSASEIAKLLPDVSPLLWGCIDGWRHEAQVLASGAAPRQANHRSAAANGQHYQSFIVRVLFNDDGSIRDTRMEHIGTGEVKRWAGWEPEGMRGFIQDAATPRLLAAPVGPLAAPVGPLDGESQPPPAPRTTVSGQPGIRLPSRSAAAARPATQPSAPRPLAPVVALRPDRTVLRAAEPFTVTLALELAETAVTSDLLVYSAVIVAKQLGGTAKQTLACLRGLAANSASTAIRVQAEGLPAGTYRLEAAVSLRVPGSSEPGELGAAAEGIILRVVPR
jgi:hypothetical protein